MSDMVSDTQEEGNDLYDPSIKQYKNYDPEEDDTSQFSSQYLNTLYTDYKTKIHSADAYMKKIQEQQKALTHTVQVWTHDLKEKFRVLDEFSKNRSKSTIPGDFAIEDRSSPVSQDQDDLKKIDSSITDNSEQINYCFNKLEDYLKFLGQTYLDAQDVVNKIYDRYMEIYDNM
jgi:hypothetical protein